MEELYTIPSSVIALENHFSDQDSDSEIDQGGEVPVAGIPSPCQKEEKEKKNGKTSQKSQAKKKKCAVSSSFVKSRQAPKVRQRNDEKKALISHRRAKQRKAFKSRKNEIRSQYLKKKVYKEKGSEIVKKKGRNKLASRLASEKSYAHHQRGFAKTSNNIHDVTEERAQDSISIVLHRSPTTFYVLPSKSLD